MKHLGEWSGRAIAVAWLVGLAVQQVALFVAGFRFSPRAATEPVPFILPRSEALVDAAKRESVLAFTYIFLRDHAQESTVVQAGNKDSLLRAWRVPASLTAEQKDSLQTTVASAVEPLAKPVAEALGTASRAIVFGMGLLLVALLFLLVLTGTWIVLRRRHARLAAA